MEVAVAAVLIAVLAAATIPTLSEFMSNRDAASTANTLSQIGTGIAAFKTGVVTSGSNGTYPRFISQLTNQITNSGANTTKSNSCGSSGTHNTNAVNTWTATGPFVTFNIPPGGLFTALGVVQDSMFRNPNSANPGTLAIRMTVDSIDAIRLDRVVDGGDGGVAGTLRYTFSVLALPAARTADVQYLVPVAAKC